MLFAAGSSVQRVLELEQAKYGDLVQASFPDTARHAIQESVCTLDVVQNPPFCITAPVSHLVTLYKNNSQDNKMAFQILMEQTFTRPG